MQDFHPELRRAHFIPKLRLGPRTSRLIRRIRIRGLDAPTGMTIEDRTITGPSEVPAIRMRLYRTTDVTERVPALFWIHGGGFVQGQPEQDDRTCIAIAQALGIVVASVAYRLAPDAPFPAPLDDVESGLDWLVRDSADLGIDPARIAVGGASAGAGLAAGLVLRVHDRGGMQPVLQLLVYPMLDDRMVLRAGIDTRRMRGWIPQNNRFGWTSYLGREPGGAHVSEDAAPARREDLSGLPPAWIGVGTNDLFYDEDVDYARRLTEAGVSCELVIVPGAFHGFDAFFSRTQVARRFLDAQIAALRSTFDLPVAPAGAPGRD